MLMMYNIYILILNMLIGYLWEEVKVYNALETHILLNRGNFIKAFIIIWGQTGEKYSLYWLICHAVLAQVWPGQLETRLTRYFSCFFLLLISLPSTSYENYFGDKEFLLYLLEVFLISRAAPLSAAGCQVRKLAPFLHE